MSTTTPFYKNGINFTCTGCGACCKTHGENAYVYLSDIDVENTARFLKMERIDFLNSYCASDEDGNIYLRMIEESCCFLDSRNQCRIYEVRPMQCRTWPFWSENIKSRTAWKTMVQSCCPGVKNGRLHSKQEIEKTAKKRDDWY
jgi:Fe-S-cluster containining protein